MAPGAPGLSPAAAPPPWGGALAARLPDGRLHLQHGPIDLVIAVDAAPDEAAAACRQAVVRFQDVLAVLVSELRLLRQPLGGTPPVLEGPVARRMLAACWPHRAVYLTPMAAVAGAVADEILAALVAGRVLRRASVNNGGDIALHLAPGEHARIGLAGIEDAALHADAVVRAGDPWRGVATSGWRGRSQSRGIADAVTVIARDAAAADAAATLVANAVDVDHPAVGRLPARAVRDDSDLGDLPVTVAVGRLPESAVAAALAAGLAVAERMRADDLIGGAMLRLQGSSVATGFPLLTRSGRERAVDPPDPGA